MPDSDNLTTAFHPGEQQIQARLGLQARMEQVGEKVIRPFMLNQHRELFEKLPLVFLGALDAQLRPWATVRVGPPGFVNTPHDQALVIQAGPLRHDPLSESLELGHDLGLLGLEFATRRRNRVSARVSDLGPQRLELEVKQSFGNCPKYIQTRSPVFVAAKKDLGFEDLGELRNPHVRLIQSADSFMISTVYQDPSDAPNRGVDISHRGGKPGFVRVENARTLSFPDFSGNMFFNTLGNLALNPRAGLLFLDFSCGDLLYLTGRAEIIWSGPELEAFAGAERLLRFQIDQLRFVPKVLPLQWDFGEFSPALDGTGRWDEAEIQRDLPSS